MKKFLSGSTAFKILKEQEQQGFGELTAYFRQIRQKHTDFALPALEASGLLLPPSVEYEDVARECTNCCITPSMHLSMINSSFAHGLLNGMWLASPIKTISALPLFTATIHLTPAEMESSVAYFLEESSSSSPTLLPASWLMSIPVVFMDLAIRSSPDVNNVNIICNVTATRAPEHGNSVIRPSTVAPGAYYALRIFYRTVDVRDGGTAAKNSHEEVAVNVHNIAQELLLHLFSNFSVKDLNQIDESKLQPIQQHEPYCKAREMASLASLQSSKGLGLGPVDLGRQQQLPGYSTILESMVNALSLLLPNKTIKEINDDLVRFVVEGSPESAFEDFRNQDERYILDPEVLAASTSADIRKYAKKQSGVMWHQQQQQQQQLGRESRLLTLARRYRRTCIEYAMINRKESGYKCDCGKAVVV